MFILKVDEKKTSSVGGIDQGLNRTIATVLLNGSTPHEELLCHSCGLKYDADLNAAHNIALRCQVDWLKVQMNSTESGASA
jgi:transposase